MGKDNPDFQVSDRRIFSVDGQASSLPAQESASPIEEHSSNPSHPAEDSPAGSADKAMTFQTLVLSLSTTAMLQMGLMASPGQPEVEKDINGAKQTIDILQILKDKTSGNLSAEESQLLEASLFDLKMWYLKASANIRL
jgi:hypothetical protein